MKRTLDDIRRKTKSGYEIRILINSLGGTKREYFRDEFGDVYNFSSIEAAIAVVNSDIFKNAVGQGVHWNTFSNSIEHQDLFSQDGRKFLVHIFKKKLR